MARTILEDLEDLEEDCVDAQLVARQRASLTMNHVGDLSIIRFLAAVRYPVEWELLEVSQKKVLVEVADIAWHAFQRVFWFLDDA